MKKNEPTIDSPHPRQTFSKELKAIGAALAGDLSSAKLTRKRKSGICNAGVRGGHQHVRIKNKDEEAITLSETFTAAMISALEKKRAALVAEEEDSYAPYLFNGPEPESKASGRKAINAFLRKAAGKEPAQDCEKDFLVRAIQHYARKWDLQLMVKNAGEYLPCRITTTSNPRQSQPKSFSVVEHGQGGKRLLSRYAVPDLMFSP